MQEKDINNHKEEQQLLLLQQFHIELIFHQVKQSFLYNYIFL